jgi:hypothetical protein
MGDDVRRRSAPPASPDVRYMVCENDHLWPDWLALGGCWTSGCESRTWRPSRVSEGEK